MRDERTSEVKGAANLLMQECGGKHLGWSGRVEESMQAEQLMRAFEIRITDGGEERYSFCCRGDEPLLNGIRRTLCTEIPRGCSGGGCGICKVIIRNGQAEPFKPMSREHITEEELTENVVLACCVKPCSDMEIGFFVPGADGAA